jgi:hypothetical protein
MRILTKPPGSIPRPPEFQRALAASDRLARALEPLYDGAIPGRA